MFNGNYDTSLERIQYLNQPFTARYVRFFPKEWNNRLSMRAGLLGCTHNGILLHNIIIKLKSPFYRSLQSWIFSCTIRNTLRFVERKTFLSNTVFSRLSLFQWKTLSIESLYP